MAEHCKTCGAEIVWAMTLNGRAIPLAVASKQKRFAIQRSNYGADYAAQVDTYLSHFADCPNADEHRKKEASNGPTR